MIVFVAEFNIHIHKIKKFTKRIDFILTANYLSNRYWFKKLFLELIIKTQTFETGFMYS